MARFGSRYARRYRRYKRFYRAFAGRGRRYGYSRKYVNATSRSSVRMKTNVNTTLALTAGYGPDCTSAVVLSATPLGPRNTQTPPNDAALSAANSALYRTYCTLYEECKIIGTKVALDVVSAVGGSDIPSLQIYTSWDRKRGNGEIAPTVQEIKDSSSSTVSTALNNNVAKLVRSCYASDLMEKATWFDASLDTTANYRNKAWAAANLNPNMFHPSFAFFLNCPSKGATSSVTVSLSITYYFAFRNPRFGGTGSSAKVVDLGARTVSFPGEDDGGDMDAELAAEASAMDAPDGDMDEPAPLSRRARSNASADLQEAAAPSTRRVRISKNGK